MKILVVDDEKTIVKGIKFNLENEGYQVDVCYDGETAVDMARRGEYAVILLDLMMPKLDGLGACQQIRQFSTVPIIMLTARSEDADKLIGFESGADDYITKPFNILELKARIRALIRRSSMAPAAPAEPDGGKLVRGHIEIDPERPSWPATSARTWSLTSSRSSTSSSCSCATPAKSTRASSCSTSCGATTIRAISAPWTCTSAACAKSSSATPPRPNTSSRSGAWATTSPRPDG